MANINPSGYEFRRRAYPDDMQNDTFRLADVILFSLGDFSSSNEKVVDDIYRDITFVCKGRENIHATQGQAVKYLYEYTPQKIVSRPSTSPIRRQSEVKTNCYQLKMYVNKDYNGDNFLMMERRKEFMGKVFAKWGINVDKLSDAIERFYTCPIDNFDDVESFDNQRKSFSTEIQNCIEYYDKYGADALFVSSHRWTLQNAIIPLMVEQDFYDNLPHKEVYDNLPFAKRKNLLLKHGLDETMSIAHNKLEKNKEKASQDYLTITNGQIFTFGKVYEWKVQHASFGDQWECTHHTYGMKVPQFTRLLDEDGKVLDETGAYEKNAVWMNEEQRFVFTSRGTFVDGERSFSRFLKFKTKFEACFPKEDVDLLCRHAERLMTNFPEHSDECIDYIQQMKSFEDLPVIRDQKTGKYYLKNPSSQNDVEKFVSAAVNKEKQYLQVESTQNCGPHGINNPNTTPQGMMRGD